MDALRAMIVDDNATDRAYLRHMLKYLTAGKVTVDEADSARGASELFQPGCYDLVVADYHLTGEETGVDVLSHVKQADPTCHRVLITGDPRARLLLDGTAENVAESVVLKSSGPAVLRDLLTPMLTNGRGRFIAQ